MLAPIWEDGKFVNPGRPPVQWTPGEEGSEVTWRDFWDWHRHRPKHPKTWHVPQAPAVDALRPAPASGIAVTWFGHSSVLLQIDGLNLLIDPVWSRRLAGGLVVPRYTPPGQRWEALPRIDALLVSHNHYDHLDAPTVKRLPRETPVFTGLGVGAWFRRRGFSRVHEMTWYDRATLDGAALTYAPAQHFSGRTLWDRDRTLWGGFVFEGREGSVAYCAGDSGYFDGFREIGERFPRIDLAMIPIGAYAPRWFMSPVHVDPQEGGQAFVDCGARTMLPIHWGTFRLADEPIDEPPRALRAWWEQRGLDPARLLLPALGETIVVDEEKKRGGGDPPESA